MKFKITFLILTAAILGCEKNEQKEFVEEINGNYYIASITLSKSDLTTDSITLTNVGEFVFDGCPIQKNKSKGFCPGYYIFNGEPKVKFGYNQADELTPYGLRIQPNNTIVITGLNLLSVYNFERSSANQIKLSTNQLVTNKQARIAVKMILSKK
ncbi:hypothetical protein GS399_08905 [Pedobacter sp. HMF7647]|uniref:Lipocalin-like domain-containing protein n=1 Tax=Hufsiella arboris TaxID=2695275 RepID=A0A7K1Y933_9SPHI|nr:hypothetical protein [Hufsiella arboris]MXV51087.1 hypothetical protein [Hufsiella arboris]